MIDSKTIPKVELHCHLEACFQAHTVEDFDRINDDAAACSFLPFEKKQCVWPRKIERLL